MGNRAPWLKSKYRCVSKTHMPSLVLTRCSVTSCWQICSWRLMNRTRRLYLIGRNSKSSSKRDAPVKTSGGSFLQCSLDETIHFKNSFIISWETYAEFVHLQLETLAPSGMMETQRGTSQLTSCRPGICSLSPVRCFWRKNACSNSFLRGWILNMLSGQLLWKRHLDVN